MAVKLATSSTMHLAMANELTMKLGTIVMYAVLENTCQPIPAPSVTRGASKIGTTKRAIARANHQLIVKQSLKMIV